jgi:hypothetical protein
VKTITRTRLQGQALPAGDLRVLSASYGAALQEQALADPVEQIEAAIEAIEAEKHTLPGLPTLLMDLRPDNDLERAFVAALSAKAASVESVSPQVSKATRPRTALQALQL